MTTITPCFSGPRLRELRTAHGLRIEHVGIDVGRSAETIRLYETGKTTPSVTTLCKLAALFGVTVDELFGGPDALA